jgi:hypothetical protein
MPTAMVARNPNVNASGGWLPAPLTELEGTYKGETGGLYGDGRNAPPGEHAQAIDHELTLVVPRDARGRVTQSGRIGLIAIGQSTNRIEFRAFSALASHRPVAPQVVLLNAAQDGMVLNNWAQAREPWAVALEEVRRAGLTRAQVQVAWLQLAQIFPWRYGDFAQRTAAYAERLGKVVRTARELFPNLRLVLLSSSKYSGYAPKGPNHEPFAYEDGFGVREAIRRQITGDPAWNWDPSRGRVVAPVLLWGPYKWSRAAQPRTGDGFSWTRADVGPDGVHDSRSGRRKIAELLWASLVHNPYTASWFGS